MEPDHERHHAQPPLPSDLSGLLETGLRHHRAGQLAEAEPFYHQVWQ